MSYIAYYNIKYNIVIDYCWGKYHNGFEYNLTF